MRWRGLRRHHRAQSSGGGVVLGNKFFEDGGRVADVLGQDWDAAWSHAGNLKAAG